MKNAFL